MVKQSFFGLPGQYGRRVTKANPGTLSVMDMFCLEDMNKCQKRFRLHVSPATHQPRSLFLCQMKGPQGWDAGQLQDYPQH